MSQNLIFNALLGSSGGPNIRQKKEEKKRAKKREKEGKKEKKGSHVFLR
jgi:hypothetical protein